MKALSHLLILLIFTGTAVAGAAGCQTEMLLEDISWCLRDASADLKGRETLLKAVETGRADAFMHGFAACQGDRFRGSKALPYQADRTNQAIGNAVACYRSDRQTLLRMARQVLERASPEAQSPPAGRHAPSEDKP